MRKGKVLDSFKIKEEGFWSAKLNTGDQHWASVSNDFVQRLLLLEAGGYQQRLKITKYCRFCGKSIGRHNKRSDNWVWPEGLTHYIKEHNIKPSLDFIQYVLAKTSTKELTTEEENLVGSDNIAYVGFFRSTESQITPLPWPYINKTPGWTKVVRNKFVERLALLQESAVRSRGGQKCVFCTYKDGGIYKSGNFYWTRILSHYVEEHEYVVPLDFYKYVLENTGAVKILQSENKYVGTNAASTDTRV